jgi:acetolactate synthase-1/2/3 large subunit
MNSHRLGAGARLAGHVLVEALIAQGIDTVFGVPSDTAYQL